VKEVKETLKSRRRIASVVVPLVLGLTAWVVYAATPSIFSAVNQPIGVAAVPGRLLVTRPFCEGTATPSTREVVSLDSAGTATQFAPLPSAPGVCREQYIAIAPGAPWTAGDVYVLQWPNILKVPAGGPATTFAIIPSAAATPESAGIVFDRVGTVGDPATFGRDMIISGGSTGELWRVTSAGVATLVTTVVGQTLEGPDVAPLGYGPLGGQVWVASETLAQVVAISPAGVVTTVVSFVGAEGVHVVPAGLANFGTSGGAFFVAVFDVNAITKFPASDFTAVAGKVLIRSENPSFDGIGLIDVNGTNTGYVVSTFQTSIGQQEGAAFVLAPIVPVVAQGRMTGGGSVFAGSLRVTHGFELHCNVSQGPNNLEVNWGKGNNFHLTNLASASCTDDPAIAPPPPNAGFDTYTGSGTGLCNGLAATATWTFTDAGEPGKNDTAKINITGGCSLSVSGNLNSGNQQAHAN
jgi:hypothetical protein